MREAYKNLLFFSAGWFVGQEVGTNAAYYIKGEGRELGISRPFISALSLGAAMLSLLIIRRALPEPHLINRNNILFIVGFLMNFYMSLVIGDVQKVFQPRHFS